MRKDPDGIRLPNKRAALQYVASHVASNLSASTTDEVLGGMTGMEDKMTVSEMKRLDWAIEEVLRRLYSMGGP